MSRSSSALPARDSRSSSMPVSVAVMRAPATAPPDSSTTRPSTTAGFIARSCSGAPVSSTRIGNTRDPDSNAKRPSATDKEAGPGVTVDANSNEPSSFTSATTNSSAELRSIKRAPAIPSTPSVAILPRTSARCGKSNASAAAPGPTVTVRNATPNEGWRTSTRCTPLASPARRKRPSIPVRAVDGWLRPSRCTGGNASTIASATGSCVAEASTRPSIASAGRANRSSSERTISPTTTLASVAGCHRSWRATTRMEPAATLRKRNLPDALEIAIRSGRSSTSGDSSETRTFAIGNPASLVTVPSTSKPCCKRSVRNASACGASTTSPAKSGWSKPTSWPGAGAAANENPPFAPVVTVSIASRRHSGHADVWR